MFKRSAFFLLVLVGVFLVWSLGCGSSGGGGGVDPYSGNFNTYIVNGGIEALVGTMQITQNGTGGSAVWHPTGEPEENAISVSFSGTTMTVTFEGDWVMTGTWSSSDLFDGTTSWGGTVIPVRLRRI